MTRETESLINNALDALFRLRDDCIHGDMAHEPVQAALDDLEQWAREVV